MLNALHGAPPDQGGPKYPLPGAAAGRRKDRVATDVEKVFLLVRWVLPILSAVTACSPSVWRSWGVPPASQAPLLGQQDPLAT